MGQDWSTKEMQQAIHENSKAHGWWDDPRQLPEIIALCHSELSEALEEFRAGMPVIYEVGNKPEGVVVELADCVIRILDFVEYLGYDLGVVIGEKHEYNKTRPYRHGGKVV
jgi:NTP pyrophosphatase (non-canonical NTP hydrolase)